MMMMLCIRYPILESDDDASSMTATSVGTVQRHGNDTDNSTQKVRRLDLPIGAPRSLIVRFSYNLLVILTSSAPCSFDRRKTVDDST